MDKNEIRQAIKELERQRSKTLEEYELREGEIRRLLKIMDKNTGQKD